MILCKITDKKNFMSKLLTEDCFHSFLIKEASISGFVSIHIDGRINTGFFSDDDPDKARLLTQEYASWSNMQKMCFDFIKGKRTPTRFHFVLYLKSEAVKQLLAKEGLTKEQTFVQNFVLNIKYEQGTITLTPAVNYASFTLDKQAEQLWDRSIIKFLTGKQIPYTIA